VARKRKLDTAGISTDAIAEDEQRLEDGSKLGGFWGGSALNMLKARLQDAHDSIVDGIMSGTVALELDPSQIIDEVGSDRIGQWDSDPSFADLVADVERRGQKQAIRVRPADSQWKPDATTPLETDARFIIQSGRRRLHALAKLGRKVLAVISTDIGDAALSDLEERFKENTMRKNLNGFEELVSIGLIAASYKDLNQEQIAANLSVPQGDVSLGLSCVDMFAEICELVDVENTPKREFRRIIPAIKAGKDPVPEVLEKTTKKVDATLPVASHKIGKGQHKAVVKPTRDGFTIKVSGYTGSDSELVQATEDFLDYLAKRQS